MLNFLGDPLLHAPDVGDFLTFQIASQILQGGFAVGVGDVLILAPQSVEPFAQIVDQVMIMVGTPSGFADVLQFFLGCE